AGRVGETRAARHGPDADHARCLRCADQAGNPFNSRLGQSGEPKVQLTGIGRNYGRDAAPQAARALGQAGGLARERKSCWLVKTLNFQLTRLKVPWDSWGPARPDANVVDVAPMRRTG